MRVYCDMVTDGGGWTVFHKRYNGQVDFFRGWEEYTNGFGDPDKEYWLGLGHIHYLTQAQSTELYVGLTDFDLGLKYARYSTFQVADETDKFRLTVANFTGNAGDSLTDHSGQRFSTKDQDNDDVSKDCSNVMHGCWWYRGCYLSDLNGRFAGTRVIDDDESYMQWYHLQNKWISLKAAFMMMRPINFKN